MDALEQQKIQVMIDLATKQLRNELDTMKSKLGVFEDEIARLRSQALAAKNRPSQPVPQQEPQAPPQQQLKQASEEKDSSQNPIDRNGIAPADVAIEKMFYCGNKSF